MKNNLLWITTHPIQYQTPLLNKLNEYGFNLEVIYFSDFSDKKYYDHEFRSDIYWNIDTKKNYKYFFLKNIAITKTELTFYSPLIYGLLTRILKSKSEHVVITGWNHYGLIIAAVLCKIFTKKIILRCEVRHYQHTHIIKKWIKNLYLKLFDYYGAIGSLNKSYYIENGIDPQKIYDMPYSVDNNKFCLDGKLINLNKSKFCNDNGINKTKPIYIYVGKLTKRKNVDQLVNDFNKILTRCNNFGNLLIVGDGELRDFVRVNSNIADGFGITYLGFKDQAELVTYLAISDILIIPSSHEPWGMVVNEAMAAGCAIISSNQVGASLDLIADGKNGLIYDISSVTGLSDSIEEISRMDYVKMGYLSLEKIQKYSYLQTCQSIEKLINV